MKYQQMTRRSFLGGAATLLAGCATVETSAPAEPVIDIHQHTGYAGRSNAELLAHQRRMGITTTVLLPAGRHYGLDASCGGNNACEQFAKKHPREFVFFANELPYLKEARSVIAAGLRAGACGIGEQKFRVLADSHWLGHVASIAREFKVPILLHFQDTDYNMELQRFPKILERFPEVNFIGHAQTWWGHVDQKHNPEVMYPKGSVTKGGLTDKLLSDYPNMFGDLSAGSGLNALLRDEEHTRWFLDKHQNKLLYGSDCDDRVGSGPACQGAQTLATVRRLVPNKAAERKILCDNARRIIPGLAG